MAELISLRTQQAISHEEFIEQRQRLGISLDRLRQNEPAGITDPLTADEVAQARGALSNLSGTWKATPPEERRALGSLLFPVGCVYGRIRTADCGLLIRVFTQPEPSKTDLAALVKNNLNTLVSDIRRLLAIARVSRIGLETGSEAA